MTKYDMTNQKQTYDSHIKNSKNAKNICKLVI